jgi:hypothetical protein
MKKTAYLMHVPHESEPESIELPQELAAAIDELPLLEMIDSIELIPLNPPEPNDPIATVTWQAEQLINKLSVYAELGKDDAIRSLRDLGNTIAETLKNLGRDKEPKHYPDNPSVFRDGCPPVVKLRGDFSTINKILADYADVPVIRQSEAPRVFPTSNQLEAPCLLVDVIDALYWRDNRANIVRDGFLTPEGREAHHYAKILMTDPRDRLRLMYNDTTPYKSDLDANSKAAAAEVILHDSIRRRIEFCLLKQALPAASNAARRVASKSLNWPDSMSAFEDESKRAKSERRRSELGSGLPFRLKRKAKSGRGRNFNKDSPMGFAIEYCTALLEIRELHGSSNDEDLLRSKLYNIEENTLPDILASEALGYDEHREKIETLDTRWQIAAALLPDFPPPEGVYRSDKVSDEWRRVAMLRAAYMCNLEWDRYPYWPQWVMNRIRNNGPSRKKRTTREAVSECLELGLKNIRG